MDEDLIYEILSVVEEIPEGKVAILRADCQPDWQGEKFQTGRKSVVYGRILWKISLPSGSEPCGPTGSRLARAGLSPGPGRGFFKRKPSCGFEKISVGR